MAATQMKQHEDVSMPVRPSHAWAKRAAAFLMLPREHGAWAMLLMPYVVGTAAAGWGGVSSLLLLTALVLVFSSSRPLEVVLQPSGDSREGNARKREAAFRLGLYLGLGGLAGVLLLLSQERWALVAIGAGAVSALAVLAYLRRHRLDRSRPARMLSIVALSASGPAAYYSSSGALDEHALAVWVLTCVYSGASLFYVRLFYRPAGRRGEGGREEGRGRAERQLAIYLLAALTGSVALGAAGRFPPLAALAMLPLVAKGVWGITRRGHNPSLKEIGLAEVWHAGLFAVLAAMAVASW